MPRARGQIDKAKNVAILNAAAEVIITRGLAAPMTAIARRAGVSKQTIYNHYGGKPDLIRALVIHRVASLMAPLETADAEAKPEEALTGFAKVLIAMAATPNGYGLLRLCIQSLAEIPGLSKDVYEAGPKTTVQRLAKFMRTEMKTGRLVIDDPLEAAEFFTGMCGGHRQLAALLGVAQPMTEAEIEQRARNVASRFMRAYRPD